MAEQGGRMDQGQGLIRNGDERKIRHEFHTPREDLPKADAEHINQRHLQCTCDTPAQEGVLLEAGRINTAQGDQDQEKPEGPLNGLKPGCIGKPSADGVAQTGLAGQEIHLECTSILENKTIYYTITDFAEKSKSC